MKNIFKQSRVYQIYRTASRNRKLKRELEKWDKAGQPDPPPHLVKQNVLKEAAREYGLGILVETGTYYGDMVEAMRKHFDKIYSIELSQALYEKACQRFRFYKHIKLRQGDSGEELENLMKEIDQPTLFWLDGHYSAGVTARGEEDTPIYKELGHIFDAPDLGHAIIIDDARCFGSTPGYPTIGDLTTFIESRRDHVQIEVAHDSIRVLPDNAQADRVDEDSGHD